jgi:ribonuclease BN (tRNA processing enzyme)
VIVSYWGTRGSLATPGPATIRYGGNTACVEVRGREGTVLVLDAGSGIRPMGANIGPGVKRLDLLISHLHLDHILGLGFFGPLFDPAMEVHIWGPGSPHLNLRARLQRYLSPPLFPVLISDLACRLTFHEVCAGTVEIGEFRVTSDFVCHPGSTVGYRVSDGGAVLTYLSDHEPALGQTGFPAAAEWTSGLDLAAGADLLIHDSQYTQGEYDARVGWGHSSLEHAIGFARLAGARRLVPFHHEPARDDTTLSAWVDEVVSRLAPPFPVTPAAEGEQVRLGASLGRESEAS